MVAHVRFTSSHGYATVRVEVCMAQVSEVAVDPIVSVDDFSIKTIVAAEAVEVAHPTDVSRV